MCLSAPASWEVGTDWHSWVQPSCWSLQRLASRAAASQSTACTVPLEAVCLLGLGCQLWGGQSTEAAVCQAHSDEILRSKAGFDSLCWRCMWWHGLFLIEQPLQPWHCAEASACWQREAGSWLGSGARALGHFRQCKTSLPPRPGAVMLGKQVDAEQCKPSYVHCSLGICWYTVSLWAGCNPWPPVQMVAWKQLIFWRAVNGNISASTPNTGEHHCPAWRFVCTGSFCWLQAFAGLWSVRKGRDRWRNGYRDAEKHCILLDKHQGRNPEKRQWVLMGAGCPRGWERWAANTPCSGGCCGKGSMTWLFAPGR